MGRLHHGSSCQGLFWGRKAGITPSPPLFSATPPLWCTAVPLIPSHFLLPHSIRVCTWMQEAGTWPRLTREQKPPALLQPGALVSGHVACWAQPWTASAMHRSLRPATASCPVPTCVPPRRALERSKHPLLPLSPDWHPPGSFQADRGNLGKRTGSRDPSTAVTTELDTLWGACFPQLLTGVGHEWPGAPQPPISGSSGQAPLAPLLSSWSPCVFPTSPWLQPGFGSCREPRCLQPQGAGVSRRWAALLKRGATARLRSLEPALLIT